MQNPNESLIMVMVTCGSDEEALEISNLVVRKRLAACVNILPVRSIYEWKSKVENQDEWLLLIKTRKERFDKLEEAIKSVHSYDLPEIIAFEMAAASDDYAKWVKSITIIS